MRVILLAAFLVGLTAPALAAFISGNKIYDKCVSSQGADTYYRGYGLTHNPGLKIKNLKMGDGDGFGPWKEEAINMALADLTGISRTVFYLAYFTGQRSSDILKMKWADIAGKEIHVVQDKTGAELWVPLHPDLQAELAITERRGKTIVAAELIRADGHPSNTAGQPISGRALHHYWGKERNRLGFAGQPI